MFYFGDLGVRDEINGPFPPIKTSTIHEKVYMRTIFIKNTRKINLKRHKYMRIPHRTWKIENKLFVTFNTRYAYILVFPDHMWIPFIDQPQPYVVVFSTIYFNIYKYIVTKWKHYISIHDIVTLNEYIER